MDAITTVKTMSPACRGAALKREKAAAAKLARAAGKVAAAERREQKNNERAQAYAEEVAAIDHQIKVARRALGVRKNEPNPVSICMMIETLTMQMHVRLSEKGLW